MIKKRWGPLSLDNNLTTNHTTDYAAAANHSSHTSDRLASARLDLAEHLELLLAHITNHGNGHVDDAVNDALVADRVENAQARIDELVGLVENDVDLLHAAVDLHGVVEIGRVLLNDARIQVVAGQTARESRVHVGVVALLADAEHLVRKLGRLAHFAIDSELAHDIAQCCHAAVESILASRDRFLVLSK